MIKSLIQGHAARIKTRSRSIVNKVFAKISKAQSNVKTPRPKTSFIFTAFSTPNGNWGGVLRICTDEHF